MPVVETIGESFPGVLGGIFWPLLVYSRGQVKARSSDPRELPSIAPRYNTHPNDLTNGVKAAKNWVEFYKTAPISNIVADPQADPAGISTDAEWAAWVKKTSFSANHYGGTSAMIPEEFGGVVDSKCKVYGTQALRIIDGGILPVQITSHTQSMLYPVALRAAMLVLQDA